MSDFEHLLEVQALDTAASRARKRCAELPERSELAEQEAESARLGQALEALGGRHEELAAVQRQREGEVSLVAEKAREEEQTLYSGSMTAARELETLQQDIAALKQRQAELEEGVLEVMEQAESIHEERTGLQGRREQIDARAAELRNAVAAAEAELEQMLAGNLQERNAAVARVPEALLSSYERLRARLAPPTVVRLEGRTCTGCRVTLPALVYATLKKEPPGAVVTCPQCARMLVR